jgi:hypothetical protein
MAQPKKTKRMTQTARIRLLLLVQGHLKRKQLSRQ